MKGADLGFWQGECICASYLPLYADDSTSSACFPSAYFFINQITRLGMAAGMMRMTAPTPALTHSLFHLLCCTHTDPVL